MPPKSRPARIQAIIPYGLQYFREVLLGARHYGFDTGRLEFCDPWLDHELKGNLVHLVRRDRVHGIIACINDRPTEKRLHSLGIPVVNISNSLLRPQIPVVTQDDHSVGRLAAHHLKSCGCQAFAFWGEPHHSYSQERLAGFREALLETGLDLQLRLNGGVPFPHGEMHIYKQMVRWLAKCPRPLGVFAALDSLALLLLRAARELHWRVPEDIAILGAGNDDFHVEFESTPLSSVQLPARAIGREAAALLDRLITKRRTRADNIHLPVRDIARRKSTDVLFIDDPAISRAAHYIREHALEPLYLADVVRISGVCRTVLQRRFRQKLGRSISAEILRVRIAHAQSLLARTDLSMAWVAEKSGFSNSQRLSMLFRHAVGMSPSAYRRQLQHRVT